MDGQGMEPPSVVLQAPDVEAETVLVRKVYTPQEQPERRSVLQQVSEERATYDAVGPDVYSAATELAAIYRLDVWSVYAELKRLYGNATMGGAETVPEAHLPALAKQIEEQTRRYEIEEEEVEVALALIRPEGFDEDRDDEGNVVYTAEITYRKDKEHLLLSWQEMMGQNDGDFGFHYDPYNFDSKPEQHFFRQMLHAINVAPEHVEDVYFTGGLTDPRKTEFHVEYKGEDGKWHRYSPDFVVRRKDGRCTIVEIKAERERAHPVDGEQGRKAMAIRSWEDLNPDTLQYEMIFTDSDSVGFNQLARVRDFITK